MKKKLFVLSIVLIIFGFIIGTSAIASSGFNWKKLDTANYVTNQYEIDDSFNKIELNERNSDITFYLSETGKNYVECKEDENASHDVLVEDNTLKISGNYYKKKFRFNLYISSPKTRIYLVDDTYESLVIKSRTSDINLPAEFTFNSININLTTGDVKCLSKCNSAKIATTTGDIRFEGLNITNTLEAKCTTGDIKLINTTVVGDANLRCTTGDITFSSFDAANIYASVTTGDIKGTINSAKIFECTTNNGDISHPDSSGSGICRLSTTTGDIKIRLA